MRELGTAGAAAWMIAPQMPSRSTQMAAGIQSGGGSSGGLAEVVHPGQLKVVLRLEGSIEYRKQVRQREGPVVEGDLRIAQHDECAQPIEELII